jgi:hypothetical protein
MHSSQIRSCFLFSPQTPGARLRGLGLRPFGRRPVGLAKGDAFGNEDNDKIKTPHRMYSELFVCWNRPIGDEDTVPKRS